MTGTRGSASTSSMPSAPFSSDSDDSDDSDDSGDEDDHTGNATGGPRLRCLPDPPALRLTEARHSPLLFAALGSSIFIGSAKQYSEQAAGSLVYDTETAAMTLGPRLPEDLYGLFVAADEKQQKKLYSLAYDDHGGQRGTDGYLVTVSVQALSWGRCPAASAGKPWIPSHEWSWECVLAPPAPFDGNDEMAASYVVHHTIFFSTRNRRIPRRDIGTYSFDTKRGEWRSHGEWMLPFEGQGYYERELDAWVGLDEDGYVCACQVASRSGQSVAPEWKKTERKLFREADTEMHLDATLTYMGNNMFCLVESVMREDVEPRYAYGDGDGCALHVTVFGMKYGREGELQATVRRTTNSFAVSKYIHGYTPVTFWM